MSADLKPPMPDDPPANVSQARGVIRRHELHRAQDIIERADKPHRFEINIPDPRRGNWTSYGVTVALHPDGTYVLEEVPER